MKTCTKCDTEKSYTEFFRRGDGYQSRCKACEKLLRAPKTAEDREKLLARKRANHHENRDKRNSDRKSRYESNKEQEIARVLSWARDNRDKRQATLQKYNAIKNRVFVEDVKVSVLMERDGDACYLCLKPLEFEKPRAVHIEHRTPLSRGGEHSYANTALSCASCNLKKHDMTEEEYRATMTPPQIPAT